MSAFTPATPQTSLEPLYQVLHHVACALHLVVVNRLWLLELPSDDAPGSPPRAYRTLPGRCYRSGVQPHGPHTTGLVQPLSRIRSVLHDVWCLQLRSILPESFVGRTKALLSFTRLLDETELPPAGSRIGHLNLASTCHGMHMRNSGRSFVLLAVSACAVCGVAAALTLPSWSLLSMPRWRVHVINLVVAPRLVRDDLNVDPAAPGCTTVECARQATQIRRSRQSSVFVAHAELQVVYF